MAGVKELALKTLGGPVRIAYPSGIVGLPSQLRKPTFSTAVGLLLRIYDRAATTDPEIQRGAGYLVARPPTAIRTPPC